jgi:hypothetical protein
VTAGPSAFATTYLPGLLAIGFGLGLTATPLSTTVMLSVPTHRLGLASGLNSTLTRVAGVFAVAILGPLMLALFSHALHVRTSGLDLPPEAASALHHEAVKLGLAQVPPGLDAETTVAVSRAIKWAFVDAFRWTVLAAAGLCGIGALVAARGIPSGTKQRSDGKL